MAKGKRGLPEGFDLDVGASPVQLGDYLDEQPYQPPTAPGQRAAESPASAAEGAAVELEPLRRRLPKRPPLRKPPRREINLRPETQRMIDELLDYIRSYSVQRDAKASEMFHGIVTMLYQAKDELDLSSLPKRGQWGSPTARAFPVALGNAFAEAISKHLEQQRSDRPRAANG